MSATNSKANPGLSAKSQASLGYVIMGLGTANLIFAAYHAFFAQAPKLNPSRALITGVVCGVRVEEVEEPLMREIRYLDKLIDELAKGKAMDKILRK